MASTEKRLCRGSRETVGSFHAAYYPGSCTEDLGDLHDPLEEVEIVEHDPHGQPARRVTDSDPCEIAWRALDLKFPWEESESDWSDWSEDDGQVIDGEETDCPGNKVVDGDDDDDDCNGQVVDETKKTNCPGKDYHKTDAEEIELEWLDTYCQQIGEYSELCDDILARLDDEDTPFTPFPPFPLKLFPPTTSACFLDGLCYHSVYKIHDTSTTASTLGYRTPQEMLQFFSMSLSSSELSYPASVYGIFAVRDDLDRRRNYILNCPRDNAVEIGKQDSFVLPLCSPCRGIYVLALALFEVDLWIKKEGDGSADKHILSAYAEVVVRSNFDAMLYGRIPGDDCNLDLVFMFLAESVEAVIQVYAKVDHPQHVRFSALSTGCDHEIVLFDDKLFGNVKLLQHIVAVKKNANLDVLLRVDE